MLLYPGQFKIPKLKAATLLWVFVLAYLIFAACFVLNDRIKIQLRQKEMDRDEVSKFLYGAITNFQEKHGRFPGSLMELAITNWPGSIKTNYLPQFTYQSRSNGFALKWTLPGSAQ